MKKVLIINQYMSLGGLEVLTFNLAKTLSHLGVSEPIVFAYDQGRIRHNIEGLYKQNGIKYCVYSKADGFSIKVVFLIIKLIYQNKIKVIHTHDLGPLIYASLAKIFCLKKIKLIHTQHSLVDFKKGDMKAQNYLKWFSIFANELTAVSEQTIEGLKSFGISNKEIYLIPNGTEFVSKPLNFEAKLTLRNTLMPLESKIYDKIWLGFLGRKLTEKGQIELIKIWSLLPEQIQKKTCLFLIGPESEPDFLIKLENERLRSPQNQNIFLLPASDQPINWLSALDIYVSASHFEGHPLSVLQAIGSGLTAFVSDIPGHKLNDFGCTFFNLKDLETGSQKLKKLIEDFFARPAGQYSLNFIQAQKIREEFGLNKMALNYEKLY